jgi:hypothetical protein
VAQSEDRRGPDRRKTVDLTRPGHLERRRPGLAGRTEDKDEYAEQQAALPPGVRRPVDISDPPKPSKSLEELLADLARLQEAMEARNQQLTGLSAAEFELAQARDKDVVKQWADQVRRLEREIAVARAEVED